MAAPPSPPAFQRFVCANCGAGMVFDPATTALKCEACGSTKAVEVAATARIEETPFNGHFDRGDEQQIAQGALQVTCPGCGSIVEFQPPEVAGKCAFCAAAIVTQPKSAEAHIAPKAVLPFRLTRERAAASVGAWLSSRWFAPNDLKKISSPSEIQGVYLPFWTYDARTITDYRGQRGEHYYVTEAFQESDGRGGYIERTRQVQRTNWYPASGRVENEFDDLIVQATNSIQGDKLRELVPWDLTQLQPYAPGFLSGFKAQRYQINLEEGFETAKAMMQSPIVQTIHQDIGGDVQQISGTDIRYFDVTFKHMLLPVWIGAYRFQGKVFQVIVNAQTGEVQGERPYSAVKIAILVLVILLVIVVLVTLQ